MENTIQLHDKKFRIMIPAEQIDKIGKKEDIERNITKAVTTAASFFQTLVLTKTSIINARNTSAGPVFLVKQTRTEKIMNVTENDAFATQLSLVRTISTYIIAQGSKNKA